MITKSILNTAPASPPVSLATMKTYLRVDGTSEDAEISAMINAATQRLEALSDRKFVSQKWDIYLDGFPCSYESNSWWDGTRDGAISELYSASNKIILPFGPLISVEEFNTYDDDNTEYAFDASNFNIDTASPFGVIALKSGSVWPQTVLRTLNGIIIQATFGYASVPQDIQEAVKILTAALYENRGDEIPKIPAQCSLLIEPYRRFKVGC
jgi:hypothetical protein